MAQKRIGKLPPRYSFILNPYQDLRLSKCPKCDRLTYPRKFALFIHIDGWGPMALGKTCKYCSRCELIMTHQDELEAELAEKFSEINPAVIGNKYLVLGTVETKTWREGLQKGPTDFNEMRHHIADFKKVLDLYYRPAGWYRADED